MKDIYIVVCLRFGGCIYLILWSRWPRLTCVLQTQTLSSQIAPHSPGLGKSCQTIIIVSRPLQMLHFQSTCCMLPHFFAYYSYMHFNLHKINKIYFDACFGWLMSWRIFTVDLINNRLIHFLVWLDSSWRMYVKVKYQMLEISSFFWNRMQWFLIYSWSKFWLTWKTDKRWWMYSNFSWLQSIGWWWQDFIICLKWNSTNHWYYKYQVLYQHTCEA